MKRIIIKTANDFQREAKGMISTIEDYFLELFNNNKAFAMSDLKIDWNNNKFYTYLINTYLKDLQDKKLIAIVTREEYEKKLQDFTFYNHPASSKIIVSCNYKKLKQEEIKDEETETFFN